MLEAIIQENGNFPHRLIRDNSFQEKLLLLYKLPQRGLRSARSAKQDKYFHFLKIIKSYTVVPRERECQM